jgi:regulator of sirC expression with transglutaminase-like and TPR domain
MTNYQYPITNAKGAGRRASVIGHWSLVLCCSILVGCASQTRPREHVAPAPDRTPPPVQTATPAPQTLEEMLKQDDFDLPRALLLFSEKYYPETSGQPHPVDIPAKLARFQEYAEQLKRELRGEHSPARRARALSDFVHLRLGLRSDPADQSGANPENLFLDRVLQNRYGYCVTLSMAYLVFGQAAGLDVTGVRIPQHFAVKFRDTDSNGMPYETILETTDFGAEHDDVYFYAQHRFSTTSVRHGVYLTPLTDRQVFGTLYNNLAGLTYNRGNIQLAVERYSRALELAPNNAEAMYNRALALRKLKRAQEGLRDLNEALRLDPNFALALMLRAGLFWDNGEKEQARADLAEAMRKQPKWVEPLMLEGQFLLEDKQYDEARKVFERVLEMRPGFKSAHLALAELEHAAGNAAEARKHLRAGQENE